MRRRVEGWDSEFAADILQHLPMMHGTMPRMRAMKWTAKPWEAIWLR